MRSSKNLKAIFTFQKWGSQFIFDAMKWVNETKIKSLWKILIRYWINYNNNSNWNMKLKITTVSSNNKPMLWVWMYH